MLIGRRIESAGSTEGRAGSNVSVFAMGVVERDATGVRGWVFALRKAKQSLITMDYRAEVTELFSHRFPV